MSRRIYLLVVSAIMIFSLCACSGAGKTADCKIIPIESNIYTQKDYEEAYQVVFDYFKGFTGCNMTEIKYAGDDYADAMKEWAENYGVDEVILLTSTFDTDSRGGDGSLNPNDTYIGWEWILARDKDGKWQHKDHGYG